MKAVGAPAMAVGDSDGSSRIAKAMAVRPGA